MVVLLGEVHGWAPCRMSQTRKTDRHRDIQTGRQAGQTCMHTDTIDTHTHTTNTQTHTQTYTYTNTHTHTHTW